MREGKWERERERDGGILGEGGEVEEGEEEEEGKGWGEFLVREGKWKRVRERERDGGNSW